MNSKLLNTAKKLVYTAFFLIITSFLLLYPSVCLTFSLNGLNLWFQKMVPSLLPFMILSGMMIRMNLTDKVIFLIRPILHPVFRIRSAPLYAIVVGFLCGFPMGARVAADLYTRNRITKAEASWLLAFCNNIGPVYFISFALPALSLKAAVPYLFGMYGLPLVYGIFLRYTYYRKELAAADANYSIYPSQGALPMGLAEALDESVTAGMEGITKLGGYMIFFNLLNMIPFLLLKNGELSATINCLLEITGGLQIMGNSNPPGALILLIFGGLSCLAQTASCIRGTGLSMKNYTMHKLVLTALSVFYYSVIFST